MRNWKRKSLHLLWFFYDQFCPCRIFWVNCLPYCFDGINLVVSWTCLVSLNWPKFWGSSPTTTTSPSTWCYVVVVAENAMNQLVHELSNGTIHGVVKGSDITSAEMKGLENCRFPYFGKLTIFLLFNGKCPKLGHWKTADKKSNHWNCEDTFKILWKINDKKTFAPELHLHIHSSITLPEKNYQ